jgi:hypothetical protein
VFKTDNLPVKLMAGRSRLAAQNDHEWFAARSRQRFAFVEIENPAMAAGLRPPTPGLSQHGRIGQSNDSESKQGDAHCHEQFSSAGFWSGSKPNQRTERFMSAR